MKLESEIESWKKYRNALDTSSREIFDQLITIARNDSAAASCSCRMLISENIFMSIVLDQQKKIYQLQKQLTQLTSSVKKEEEKQFPIKKIE